MGKTHQTIQMLLLVKEVTSCLIDVHMCDQSASWQWVSLSETLLQTIRWHQTLGSMFKGMCVQGQTVTWDCPCGWHGCFCSRYRTVGEDPVMKQHLKEAHRKWAGPCFYKHLSRLLLKIVPQNNSPEGSWSENENMQQQCGHFGTWCGICSAPHPFCLALGYLWLAFSWQCVERLKWALISQLRHVA